MTQSLIIHTTKGSVRALAKRRATTFPEEKWLVIKCKQFKVISYDVANGSYTHTVNTM